MTEEVEIADGIFAKRREFIVGSAASVAFLNLVNTFAAAQDSSTYQQFLDAANPLAKSLIGDTSTAGQDEYLHSIAALAAHIDAVPDPAAWNDSTQSFTPGTEIGFTPGGESFTVLHWRLAPNTEIRLHRHDYGNVVTLGLGGEARVRNFEVVSEDRDYVPGNIVRIRKTVDQQLTKGNINLVSLDRNNIHGFIAGPEGAHGLDITTRLKPRPEHGTPYLGVRDEALDDVRQIYEAEWQE